MFSLVFPNFTLNCVTMSCSWSFLVLTKISQQLLVGLPLNLVHILMIPTGGIPPTLVTR